MHVYIHMCLLIEDVHILQCVKIRKYKIESNLLVFVSNTN